ncbi:MAG: metallophosphoesterase [Candidatus Sumerlaeia bacterium]|nr:metallophosphoesterase [Candidatus Sumerlaeia bacterium]
MKGKSRRGVGRRFIRRGGSGGGFGWTLSGAGCSLPPMTLRVLTFLLVVAALGHVWLQVFNRLLLEMDDRPRKRALMDVSLVGIVVLPVALLVFFWGHEPVAQALAWQPGTTGARVLFGGFGILWLAGLWRGWLWACDRVLPVRSRRLRRQSIAVPTVPRPGSRVPFFLRSFETTYELEVVERDLEVPGLPAEFDGLTVAQVSDLHYDPRFGQRAVYDAIARLVENWQADVVVFTGDFINDARLIRRSVGFHARMKGRAATLAVLGNHDYWTDPQAIRDECARRGIRVLGGERFVLERAGRGVLFVGTDAPWNGERADWRRLMDRRPGDTVVVLSHTPDNAPAAAQAGANLVLSGHNHGGQYCLPFIGPVVVPSRLGHRFVHGVYDVGPDCVLCVSRGLGTSDAGTHRGGGRLLCPLELVLLRLRSPAVDVAVPVAERRRKLVATVPSISGPA